VIGRRASRWPVDHRSAGGGDRGLGGQLARLPGQRVTGTDGLFWVARGSPRDRMLPRHPRLRQVVWALPDRLQPGPQNSVWVYALSPIGERVHDLQGPGDRFHFVTGVRERHGTVSMGSLVSDSVGVFNL
jgi:hypothetical protein